MNCSLETCNRKVRYNKLCNKHAEWQRRNPKSKIEYNEQRDSELHGMTDTPEYKLWGAMLQRCNNPNHIAYEHYGGRGIKVCDRWLTSFVSFYTDMGARPKGTSLDREDNDKGYSPENCKWSTQTEQIRNRRMNKNNSSGCVGVSKSGGRWQADRMRNGKRLRKSFSTFDEAKAFILAQV